MSDKHWDRLGSRAIGRYAFLHLRADRYRLQPGGAEAEFVVCESPDWVLVIPCTRDGQIVFVRQYRHGIQQEVLELPGGVLDAGESPAAAAVRELREETGYEAATWTSLGQLLPNPAMHTATAHVFLAEGCRPAGSPNLDELEHLAPVLRPRAAVPEMIRTGELCHAQMLAAFALWDPPRAPAPSPTASDPVAHAYLAEARVQIDKAMAVIAHCLAQLDDSQLGWRPATSLNSIGNLVLHLCGNVRQWIVSGAGGRPDHRNRPAEFADPGPFQKADLLARLEQLQSAVAETLDGLRTESLTAPCRIQGFDTTRLAAIFDSVAHFKGHAQEIVCLTRSQLGAAYQFQWMPSSPEEGGPA